MRLLLFLAAFLVAILLTAPLDRWILDWLRAPLATVGATVDVEHLGLAFPAGLRADSIAIAAAQGSLDVDTVYVGLTRSFEAEACGGNVRGRVGQDSVTMTLDQVDPSRCLRVGKLALTGTFDGDLNIQGTDFWKTGAAGSSAASVDLTCAGGTFGGSLMGAGQGGGDLPLGEWEFRDLVLQATLRAGELVIKQGRATTSGVEWELLQAQLPEPDRGGRLRVDFRARATNDSPRARAVLGLMPKGRVDAGGWHQFRVTGSLESPRVVALD